MKIPEFATKKELFDFLVKNKEQIISARKAEIKRADAVQLSIPTDELITIKSETKGDSVQVRVVINTTNLMDSHKDVHLPGLWKKSLQESGKRLMHLQEHKMEFDKIISDKRDLKAYTKTYSWKELGVKYEGNTEALVFDSTIKMKRNPYMFEMYKEGNIDNHSVGMQYVKMFMAVNDEEYQQEFENWEKYYPEIANKDAADESGYFFVVKEAKVIEGSAVPAGSNWVTPTLDIKEPPDGTQTKEPAQVTPEVFKSIINNFNFFNNG
jgi:hypothetical protein